MNTYRIGIYIYIYAYIYAYGCVLVGDREKGFPTPWRQYRMNRKGISPCPLTPTP